MSLVPQGQRALGLVVTRGRKARGAILKRFLEKNLKVADMI